MRVSTCSLALSAALLLGCGARSSLLVEDTATGEGGSGGSGTTTAEPSCAEKPWAVSFGSESGGNTVSVFVRRVTAAPDGRTLVFGSFTGTITFGGQTIEAAAGADYFLLMLDACGELLWMKRISDGTAESPSTGDAVLDADGNVLFAGTAFGPVDFGSGPTGDSSTFDVLVAKLDPSGNMLWTRRWTGDSAQRGELVLAGPGGEVVVLGSFVGTMVVEGQSVVGNPEIEEPFVARLSPDGALIGDVLPFPGGVGAVQAATMAPGGDFFLAFYYGDGLNLPPVPPPSGPGVAVVRVTGAGPEIAGSFTGDSPWVTGLQAREEGLFIVGERYGKILYEEPFGGSAALGEEYAYFVCRTGGEPDSPLLESLGEDVVLRGSYGAGDLYLTGGFGKGTDVLGQKGDLPAGSFLLRATPDLKGAYLKELGGQGYRDFASVFVESSGALLVGGSFSGTLDFGSGPISSKGSTVVQVDGFVAKVFED